MNIGEAVKERIIELCRERDISINKLCNMSGVTQSTVNNIVRGRNNSATISTIKKLCDGLGITIQEFFASNLFAELEQEIELYGRRLLRCRRRLTLSLPMLFFLGLILRNCSLFFLPPHNELSHLPFFCVLSKQTRCFLLGAEQHNKRWLLMYGVL